MPPTDSIAVIPEHAPTSSNKPGLLSSVKPAKYFSRGVNQALRPLYIIGFIILVVLVGIFIATITSVDLYLVKPYLGGRVLTTEGQGINGAQVELAGFASTITDNSGNFYLPNLEPGTYKLGVKATGYETFEQDVTISRSFLNYSNIVNPRLTKAGIAQISGKLIATPGYQFLDDQLMINGQGVKLNIDGTFAANTTSGLGNLTFASDNFRDEEVEFRLNSGQNPPLQDITLVSTGDIVGSLVSYVKEKTVSDLVIEITEVPQVKITKQDKSFRVQDLEPGREYTMRISQPQHQTREYKVSIKQGLNSVTNFRIVEKGYIPLLRKFDNENQLFAVQYDGEGTVQLTNEKRFNPIGEYIENDIVYVLSDRDRVRSSISGNVLLAYAANVFGQFPQRLTEETANLGKIIPNFPAKMMASVGEGTDRTHRKLEVMGLDGKNRKEIFYTTDGVFDDVVMASNGKFLYFTVQNKSGTINGLYYVDLNNIKPRRIITRTNIQVFDVSYDGNKVLYTAYNDNTDLVELYVYTISTGQEKLLSSNIGVNTQYQFVDNSDNLILYQAYRQNGSNVFVLNIREDTETRLTEFSGTEGVEAVYQQGGYVLYQTNRGMYILDVDNPHSGKLVTTDFVRYTGYDF